MHSEALLTDLPFEAETPMVGILWPAFRALGRIPRSDQAHDILTTFDPATMEAIFLSHTWWVKPSASDKHDAGSPDYPDGHEQAHLKYRVVCKGVTELMRRDIIDESKQTLIWMDWFSIDQLDQDLKLRGIRSLLYYTTLSRAMLVPTKEFVVEAPFPEKLETYGTRACEPSGWDANQQSQRSAECGRPLGSRHYIRR